MPPLLTGGSVPELRIARLCQGLSSAKRASQLAPAEKSFHFFLTLCCRLTSPDVSIHCQPHSETRASTRKFAGRLAGVSTGHALYAAFNWCFDNPLYITVICKLGLVAGGLVMTLLSLILSLGTLLAYEKMKIDWVGAGWASQLAASSEGSILHRLLRWARSRGGVPVFLVLSVFQDPFITTAWFRGGKFDSFSRSDWRAFSASVVVSNLYWTLRSGAVGAIAIALWKQL